MFESIYEFTKGVMSVEYETPIPYQITVYFIIGIIFTILIIVFRNSLDLSVLRDSYMYYYFIFMFNIINICLVLGYYYMKSGTYVGDKGSPGKKGIDGVLGDDVNCTLCTKKNIFMKKTNDYENKIDISFENLAKMMISSELTNSINQITTQLESNVFDYSEFSYNLIEGTYDTENEMTKAFLLISKYNEYPIIRYFNFILGVSNIDDEQTGTFAKPRKDTMNNLALSYTVSGGAEENFINAFLVNGAFRYPQNFKSIGVFSTESIINENKIQNFKIMQLIPPPFDSSDNQIEGDLMKEDENDEYVSLGYAIIDDEISNYGSELRSYACLKKSCCKKLSPSDLSFIFMYPCTSGVDTNIEVSDITEGNMNLDLVEGYFSVWRTPLNTIYIKVSSGFDSFIENKSLIENLYYDKTINSIPNNIYDRNNDDIEVINIKKSLKTKLKIKLQKLKIPGSIVATTIFSNTIDTIKNDLQLFYNKHMDKFNPNNRNSLKLNNARDKNLISTNDISVILKEIETQMEENHLKSIEEDKKKYDDMKKARIRKIYTSKENDKDDNFLNNYEFKKDYQSIKDKILTMSMKIENTKTMYGLFKTIFPGGFGTRMKFEDLTNTQIRIFNLISVIIPPQENIYTIRNKCLVFEKIDEDKQKLLQELEIILNKYRIYMDTLSNERVLRNSCGSKKKIERMNKQLGKEYESIYNYVGQFSSFDSENFYQSFGNLSKAKIDYLRNAFLRINRIISNTCF